jgi:hypothetical protein
VADAHKKHLFLQSFLKWFFEFLLDNSDELLLGKDSTRIKFKGLQEEDFKSFTSSVANPFEFFEEIS